MIAHEAVVGSLTLVSQLQPALALLHNLVLLQLEMPANHSLEAFGRVLYVLQHCEFDIAVANDVCIGFILLFSFESALLVFKSGFIEIDIFAHDDGLD